MEYPTVIQIHYHQRAGHANMPKVEWFKLHVFRAKKVQNDYFCSFCLGLHYHSQNTIKNPTGQLLVHKQHEHTTTKLDCVYSHFHCI